MSEINVNTKTTKSYNTKNQVEINTQDRKSNRKEKKIRDKKSNFVIYSLVIGIISSIIGAVLYNSFFS